MKFSLMKFYYDPKEIIIKLKLLGFHSVTDEINNLSVGFSASVY